MTRYAKRALLTVALVLAPALCFAATGTIAPFPKHQFFDANGDPLSGAKLFTYASGTTTKLSTYTDSALSSANTNPIVLDSAGRATIFLSPNSFKFVLAPASDTDPPGSPYWTVDNVNAVPPSTVDIDMTATAGETLSAGVVAYLSAGDGGRTAGRWYLADADTDYMSTSAKALGITTAAIASGSTGTIRIAGRATGLTALTTGSTYYISTTAGALTSTPPTNQRAIGIADTTTTLILSQWIPPSEVTATLAGIIGTGANTMAGVKSFNDHLQFEPGSSTGTYAQAQGRLSSNTTTVGNVGACGPDSLMSYAVPASTLDANGRSIVVMGGGTGASNVNNKAVVLLFDGTTILNTANFTTEMVTGWSFWAQCTREDATHAKCVTMWATYAVGVGSGIRSSYVRVTVADWTSARTFLVQASGCAATDDIVQEVMTVNAN